MLNSTLEPDKLVRLQRSLPRSTALLVRVRAGLGNVGLQCFHVLLEQAQPVAHALQPRRGRLIEPRDELRLRRAGRRALAGVSSDGRAGVGGFLRLGWRGAASPPPAPPKHLCRLAI